MPPFTLDSLIAAATAVLARQPNPPTPADLVAATVRAASLLPAITLVRLSTEAKDHLDSLGLTPQDYLAMLHALAPEKVVAP